jgi:hypothetical protein
VYTQTGMESSYGVGFLFPFALCYNFSMETNFSGPGGPPSPGEELNGNEHRVEDEANSRFYYRQGESLSSELIASAEEPQELFMGLRSLEKMLEDGNIPNELSERYTPPRQLSLMYERAEVLGMKIEDLVNQKFLTYDKNGKLVPTKTKFAALALSIDQTGRAPVYDFGTPEKRVEMARAYEKAVLELEARSILGDHISLRTNLDYRDSLEGLTYMLHSGRMPKFRADHIQALFNMPCVNELATDPENHKLGDQVEEAIFLNLVMLNSGTKNKMQDFLSRPGANVLIDRMRGGMDRNEWVERYIGVVDVWEDDKDRTLTTYKKEPRGLLTQWSNIASFEGDGPSDNFSAEKEVGFIEGAVGKLIGSNEASWIAATMMRVIGAYASEGYVALPSGVSSLKLGEGRYISSDDTGKFWAYMFNYKEGMKGRPSGLKDMIGRIPDMAMNLFDWAQVEVELPDGTMAKRSVWDAWLGTPDGKVKKDLLTGQPTTDKTIEEPYHRLGDLNFKSLDRDFHGTFSIMQWLMGNEKGPTGIFVDAMRVEGFRPEDFSLNELKKKVKYYQICLNPVILTKGSPHLYVNVKESTPKIQKNFLRNLMSARIRSAAFSMDILGSTSRLLNPKSGAQVEVPTTRLIEIFINEALKNAPIDEEELVKHYVDNNFVLRTAGTMDKVESVLVNATFEDKVGKVTGKIN